MSKFRLSLLESGVSMIEKVKQVVIEYAGAGWYGEVYGFGDSWSWAAAVDRTDRLRCLGSFGFSSAAAAERSLKAFVKVEQEADIDRWLRIVELL